VQLFDFIERLDKLEHAGTCFALFTDRFDGEVASCGVLLVQKEVGLFGVVNVVLLEVVHELVGVGEILGDHLPFRSGLVLLVTVHQLVDTLLDLLDGLRWARETLDLLNVAQFQLRMSIRQESQLLLVSLQIVKRIFPVTLLLWLLDFFDHLLLCFLGRLGGRNRCTFGE